MAINEVQPLRAEDVSFRPGRQALQSIDRDRAIGVARRVLNTKGYSVSQDEVRLLASQYLRVLGLT